MRDTEQGEARLLGGEHNEGKKEFKMDDWEKEMAAEEAKLSAMEREIDKAEAEVDRALNDCNRAFGSSRSSMESPRRQYTPEEMKKGQEMLEKAGMFVMKSAATTVACAGAGVVSLFKRDSEPLSKTFEWCKKIVMEEMRYETCGKCRI